MRRLIEPSHLDLCCLQSLLLSPVAVKERKCIFLTLNHDSAAHFKLKKMKFLIFFISFKHWFHAEQQAPQPCDPRVLRQEPSRLQTGVARESQKHKICPNSVHQNGNGCSSSSFFRRDANYFDTAVSPNVHSSYRPFEPQREKM